MQLRDAPRRAEYPLAVLCIGLWQKVQMRDAPHLLEEALAVHVIGLWQGVQLRVAPRCGKSLWRDYV